MREKYVSSSACVGIIVCVCVCVCVCGKSWHLLFHHLRPVCCSLHLFEFHLFVLSVVFLMDSAGKMSSLLLSLQTYCALTAMMIFRDGVVVSWCLLLGVHFDNSNTLDANTLIIPVQQYFVDGISCIAFQMLLSFVLEVAPPLFLTDVRCTHFVVDLCTLIKIEPNSVIIIHHPGRL